MAELITMPKMGFDMAEGTLVEWAKQVGDEVTSGDVLAIIETDKANVEVTTFVSGVLRKLLADVGAVVPVGQPIAVVGTADEDIEQLDLGAGEVGAAPKPEKPPETEEPQPEAAAGREEQPGVEEGRTLVSPVARRMVEELGIELSHVSGSGPGGRIIKRDVERYLRERDKAPGAKEAPPIATPAYEPTTDEYRVEPTSPIRRTIARRMTESKQQAPHFYITMDVDMQAAMDLRKQMNDLVADDERISVNDLVIKAASVALREFPRINASFAGDEIHIHKAINIGIAVARESGLITVVVKNCDEKTIPVIAREVRALVDRARDGRMQAEDMMGATFTVSNLGMFGVEDFVAIINPPQAAILAVGAVQRVPAVNQAGELVAGTRMKMTISADHRVTDGVEAAEFLRSVKNALEQPVKLVM